MMHNILKRIETVVPTLDGWCSVRKAEMLACLVHAIRPNLVVEIGVYAGRSAIPMAMTLQHNGIGFIHCIDAWSPQVSAKNEVSEHAEWWSKIDHEAIFKKFSTSIRELDVAHRCVVFKQKSDDVQPPPVIDLLHIDGSHTDQAVRDAERFVPNVRKGGFVVMDDIDWVGGGVLRAIDVVRRIGADEITRCTIEPTDNWAVFQIK